jgi:hypothetical protein
MIGQWAFYIGSDLPNGPIPSPCLIGWTDPLWNYLRRPNSPIQWPADLTVRNQDLKVFYSLSPLKIFSGETPVMEEARYYVAVKVPPFAPSCNPQTRQL